MAQSKKRDSTSPAHRLPNRNKYVAFVASLTDGNPLRRWQPVAGVGTVFACVRISAQRDGPGWVQPKGNMNHIGIFSVPKPDRSVGCMEANWEGFLAKCPADFKIR